MSTIKSAAKENKRAIDIRFTELFKELQTEKKVGSVVEFAEQLAVTHPNNIHSIFRSAEGEKTSVRHVNEELILAMCKVFDVNELYFRYGTLPKFIPRTQKNTVVSKKYKAPLAAIMDVFGLKDKDVAKLLKTSITRVETLKQGLKEDELNLNELRRLHSELDIPYEFMIDFKGEADLIKKLVSDKFLFYSNRLHALLRTAEDENNKKSKIGKRNRIVS